MVLKKLNLNNSFDLLDGAADLKKYVFINLRKQYRQERSGFCASEF